MLNEELIMQMTEFDGANPDLIQHFLKVHEFARVIADQEAIDEATLKILDIATILHDIAIRPCQEKYGYCNGRLQEQEGPAFARELLQEFPEVTAQETERICYLIAHHHTYENVDGMDYQILLEADFLVNAYENKMDTDSIIKFRDKVFRTFTGLNLLNTMFGL